MTNTPEQSQLGKASAYTDQYDPTLLFPIPRAGKRAEIGIADIPPFFGADLWTAFEVSWLNLRGKPQVALVHFTIPCESPNIVESKSFKLYLNSFSNSRFASADEVRQRIAEDVGAAVWQPVASVSQQASGGAPPSTVGVRLVLPEQFAAQSVQELEGLSLDRLDVECSDYQPAPHWLRADTAEAAVTETRTSH